MILAIMAVIVLALTIVAWILFDTGKKDPGSSGVVTSAMLLHGVAMLLWMGFTALSITESVALGSTIQMVLGVSGTVLVLVELVGILLAAGIPDRLKRKGTVEQDDEFKANYKRRLYNGDSRNKKKAYWED